MCVLCEQVRGMSALLVWVVAGIFIYILLFRSALLNKHKKKIHFSFFYLNGKIRHRERNLIKRNYDTCVHINWDFIKNVGILMRFFLYIL